MNVCLCVIATGKYTSFLPQLLCSVERYFQINDNKQIFIFTDDTDYIFRGLDIIIWLKQVRRAVEIRLIASELRMSPTITSNISAMVEAELNAIDYPEEISFNIATEVVQELLSGNRDIKPTKNSLPRVGLMFYASAGSLEQFGGPRGKGFMLYDNGKEWFSSPNVYLV